MTYEGNDNEAIGNVSQNAVGLTKLRMQLNGCALLFCAAPGIMNAVGTVFIASAEPHRFEWKNPQQGRWCEQADHPAIGSRAGAIFRLQLSDVLQRRATNNIQQSLLDIVAVLKRIGETLEENYSAEDFACDVTVYAAYIERTLHNLKIVGVVPKDQNADPELSGIFVPLRIALKEQTINKAFEAVGLLVGFCRKDPSFDMIGLSPYVLLNTMRGFRKDMRTVVAR